MSKTMKNNTKKILLSVFLSAVCGASAMELAVAEEEEVFPEHLAWRENLLYSLGARTVALSEACDGREVFKKLLESSPTDLASSFWGEPLWLRVRRSCDYKMIEVLREYEKKPGVLEKLSNTARLGIAIADQNLEEVRELVKKTDIQPNRPVHLLDLAIEYAFAPPTSLNGDAPQREEHGDVMQKSREIVTLVMGLPGLDVTACKSGSPLLHPAIIEHHCNSGPVITHMYDPKWYLFTTILDCRVALNPSLDLNVRTKFGNSLLRVVCKTNAPPAVVRRLCDEPDLDIETSGITTNHIFEAWRYEDWPVIDVLYTLAERGLTFQKEIECPKQWELADHALVLGAHIGRVNFSQGEDFLFGLWEDWIASLDDWGSCPDSPINTDLCSNALERKAKKNLSDPRDVAILSAMRFFLEIIVGEAKNRLPSEWMPSKNDINLPCPHGRDYCGRTLLFWAAARGRADVCRLLLERGCAAEVSNDRGYTALHIAALHGYVDIVRLIINASIYRQKVSETFVMPTIMYAKTLSGFTAHELACRAKREETVKLFQSYENLRSQGQNFWHQLW